MPPVILSSDSHVFEPPDLWQTRIDASFRDRAPRIQRIDGADQIVVEADQILSNTRSDANRFREELKQKAQTEAAGIVKNAERQIELETARALQQIRTEAVDLSVALASKLLELNLSKADNERLIEETFKQIEERRPS